MTMNPVVGGHRRGDSGGLVGTIGRYTLFGEIASGGMASVHLGRMAGEAGFAKVVAIKRPHPHLVKNPEFARMVIDEARLAARIHHPNVVATLDVVAADQELLLVFEYVHGETLWHLLAASEARGIRVPPAIVSTIIVNVLQGLHAAHEAVDERGMPLGIVHRDVSPQNIMIGVDGIARVLDFGVAKATGRLQSTVEGQLKGKLAYMAPEQVRGTAIDRRTDLYSISAVLWGMLVGRRLIQGDNEAQLLNRILAGGFAPPSAHVPSFSAQVDEIVMRGLSGDPSHRFQSAREMATAVEAVLGTVSTFQVGEWVKSLAAEAIALRAQRIRELESSSDVHVALNADKSLVESGRFGIATPIVLGDPGRTAVLQSSEHPSSPSASARYALPPQYHQHASGTPPPPYLAPTRHGLVEAPASQGSERRSSIGVLAVVAVLVFAVTLVGTLVWYRRVASPAAAAPPPIAATAPPPPVLPTETATATTTAPLPPTTGTTVSVTPTTTTTTTPTPTTPPSAAPTTKPTSKTIPRPPNTARPKPNDCETTPFVVDSEGLKRVRPECM